MTSNYLRNPAEIYRHSMATIAAEAELERVPNDLRDIAIRLVHACGMTDLIADLVWSAGVSQAARAALARGAAVLCDSTMVAAGIIRRRLPTDNPVVCAIDSAEAASVAAVRHTTRAAAAVELWEPRLPGAVVAIGNAPTALFRLLELIDEGRAKPAAIIAFPVGFVGAIESKDALAADSRGVPFLTLRGRRGGSAMAAAAINALGAERGAP